MRTRDVAPNLDPEVCLGPVLVIGVVELGAAHGKGVGHLGVKVLVSRENLREGKGPVENLIWYTMDS